MNETISLKIFLEAIIFGAVISFISVKAKFLTKSGSYAIFVLAVIIFSLSEWKGTIPILVFFVFSSILSVVRKTENSAVDEYFDKTGTRDWVQVFANGGVAAVFIIFYAVFSNELFYAAYVSSIAAVCADTWGTEIGTLFSSRTLNVLNFKPVRRGVSGGISLPGTIGGLLGALFIAVSSLYWIKFDYLHYILIVVSAGFAGSIVDSVLGASVQIQYKCNACGIVTEKKKHCSTATTPLKGLCFFNNDTVNLFASISGGFFALIFF